MQGQLQCHLSSNKEIQAGVSQGSVLEPMLNSIFKYDIPDMQHMFKALFTYDTALEAQAYHHNKTAENT